MFYEGLYAGARFTGYEYYYIYDAYVPDYGNGKDYGYSVRCVADT